MEFDLAIRAPRMITPHGEVPRVVGVSRGRIVVVEPLDAAIEAAKVLELGSHEVLMPGLVDSHVHICEPGNTDWEGFASATRAAAAGGITTLVDMPLDSVPSTVDVRALEVKRAAAEGQVHVDVGFWGGLIPGNRANLLPMLNAGVLGFKCFLGDAGTPDFPSVAVSELAEALGLLRDRDAPLLVHAESASRLPAAVGPRYAAYLASRPRGIENLAVAEVIEAARDTGGRAHIVHLSSSDALPMIASARHDGVSLTAETCPHYLALSAEEIADGATAFKCSPPIREAANRDLLWEGLVSGLLDQVVSDHSPATPQMKEVASGDFGAAWGGISSLQLSLPVTWTHARRRGFSLVDIAVWMAERPARLAGLSRKGRIAVGHDADFAVFVPDETFIADATSLHHRHPVTPYAGRTLYGIVRHTFLRGRRVDLAQPAGQLLRRGSM
jgi:allantoinase